MNLHTYPFYTHFSICSYIVDAIVLMLYWLAAGLSYFFDRVPIICYAMSYFTWHQWLLVCMCSVRINERKHRGVADNKKMAYLVDLKTVAISKW